MNLNKEELETIFKALDLYARIHKDHERIMVIKDKINDLNSLTDTCPHYSCSELLCGHNGNGCTVQAELNELMDEVKSDLESHLDDMSDDERESILDSVQSFKTWALEHVQRNYDDIEV